MNLEHLERLTRAIMDVLVAALVLRPVMPEAFILGRMGREEFVDLYEELSRECGMEAAAAVVSLRAKELDAVAVFIMGELPGEQHIVSVIAACEEGTLELTQPYDDKKMAIGEPELTFGVQNMLIDHLFTHFTRPYDMSYGRNYRIGGRYGTA